MEQLRVLMLNNEYPPLGGGTASVTAELLREYSTRSDIAVDLLTASGDGTESTMALSDNVRIFYLPVKVSCLHHATMPELLRYAGHATAASRRLHHLNPYQVVLAFCSVPAGIAAWALHRMERLPYVVRLSGPDIPGFEDRYRVIYPILTPVLRTIWKRSATVIAKCKEEEELARRTFGALRCRLVPNGVDSSKFVPRALVRNGAESEVKIVCVARLVKRKGQALLLDVLWRLRQKGLNARLALVGTGDEEATYRARVQELGIHPSVDFVGYVDRDQMPAIYQKADIFVLPSANEGMSIALLEGLAAGLPVVTTAVGGVEELVRDGENGFVVPVGDAGRMEGALEALIRDGNLRDRMGVNARRTAEGRSWRSVAERLLGELQSCISRPENPSR